MAETQMERVARQMRHGALGLKEGAAQYERAARFLERTATLFERHPEHAEPFGQLAEALLSFLPMADGLSVSLDASEAFLAQLEKVDGQSSDE